MPRGGKRKGAGRPRKLSNLERWTLGAICERLWNEAKGVAENAAVKKATKEVRKEWQKAQAVPVADRPKWFKSQAFEDYEDDIEWALEHDADKDDAAGVVYRNCGNRYWSGGRFITVRVRRPKGPRLKIIAHVASEKGITVDLVEKCWKEFKKLQKRLPD